MSLIIKCIAVVPHFLQDISGDIKVISQVIREKTDALELTPIERGMILKASNLSNLMEVLSRLWNIDFTQPLNVREIGLWNVEILENAAQEDMRLIIRCAYILCEKIFSRKRNELLR